MYACADSADYYLPLYVSTIVKQNLSMTTLKA